jgi:cystathionine gamma-lyase
MTDHQGGFGTRCVHAGQQPDPTTGAIMTPVYLTSTYVQASPGVFKDGYDYSRSKNPTRTALEDNLASLEGGRHGLCFSSGLGAMDCVLHQLRAGDHVVLSDDVYGGSFRLIDKVFRHAGLECTRVDMTNLQQVQGAMRPRTRLVWLETPSNPMLKVLDIRGVRRIVDDAARGMSPHGANDPALGPLGAPLARPMFVVDNTFASPALQNPLSQGRACRAALVHEVHRRAQRPGRGRPGDER